MRSTVKPPSDRRLNNTYRLYSLFLKSHLPLPCPEFPDADLEEVELFEAPDSLFSEAYQNAPIRSNSKEWFHYARLRDGSDFLRWPGLFQFLVSPDGRHIACHTLNGTSQEILQTYLLGQVLSFALLKQGVEPLHATTVVINDRAAAFLGDSGYGKSSLGAACLQAGHRLLTDDLLVVTEKNGCCLAHPGPPRIKLFPHIAKTLLGELPVGTPMNPQTPKLVIPLPAHLSSDTPAPLRALYVLQPPSGSRNRRITITPLSPRRACLALIANTFNTVIRERTRLTTQFNLAAQLAAAVPVKSLAYPDDPARLPAVVDAITADLAL
jgi:hypothetical protein